MVVAVSVFELHFPTSRSLKGKRRVLKGLLERIQRRHRVSIAETDHHDLWQRAEIAIACVDRSPASLERRLEAMRAEIESCPDAQLLHWEPQFLEASS